MGRPEAKRPYPLTRASRCNSCAHFRFAGGDKLKVCLYILDTGHPRDCTPYECDKYKRQCGESEIEAALKRMGIIL